MTTTSPPPTSATARPSRRIQGLDVARGVAIIGTLATNIWIFSHPGGMLGYLADPLSAGAPTWQRFAEHLLQALANGKFLGLLTLMFGIGLAIQARSAHRSGRRWPGPYLWRAGILLLDGLLHYLLVVEFDILMGYAVTGAVVAYLLAASPRTQRLWMMIAAAVHLTLVAVITGSLATAGGLALTGPGGVNPYRDGSWWDLVLLRVDAAGLFRFEPVFLLALGVAMFLLGARLYRAGLFAPEGAVLRRRLIVLGAVALPLDLLLALTGPVWTFFLHRYLLAQLVAVGLLALLAHLTLNRSLGPVGRRLAEVGRVALSAYVLQNVLGSVLFYGWGLDLGAVAPALRLPVTVGAWLLICGLVVAFAQLWLRVFSRGPVEWVWARMYDVAVGVRPQHRTRNRPVVESAGDHVQAVPTGPGIRR